MVHCNPSLAVLVPIEERELRDPKKIVLTLRNDVKSLCNLLTECTESVENN